MYKTGMVIFGLAPGREGRVHMMKAKDNFRFFPVPGDKYPPLIPSLGPNSSILGFEDSRTNDSIIWAGTPAACRK